MLLIRLLGMVQRTIPRPEVLLSLANVVGLAAAPTAVPGLQLLPLSACSQSLDAGNEPFETRTLYTVGALAATTVCHPVRGERRKSGSGLGIPNALNSEGQGLNRSGGLVFLVGHRSVDSCIVGAHVAIFLASVGHLMKHGTNQPQRMFECGE